MNIGFKDIHELSASLLTKNTIEESVSYIIKAIEDEIPIQSMGIFIKNDMSDYFIIKMYRYLSPNYARDAQIHVEDKVLKDLQRLNILRYTDSHEKFEYSAIDLLIIPLYHHNSLFGFLFVDRKNDYFSDYEIAKISVFCSLLSLIMTINSLQIQVEKANELDSNTGFYNHKGFLKYCIKKHAVMHRYDRVYSLCLLKIDNLEEVAQIVGNNKLPMFFQEISSIIKNNIRDTDIVGVLFSDMFALFLYEATKEQGEIVKNRIQDSLTKNPRFVSVVFKWAINDNLASKCDFVELLSKTEAEL